MEGFDFAAEIRVRFAETDAQGVAHNSNYLVWFEVARVEFLERYAGGYQRLRDTGDRVVRARVARAVPAPARFDDRLLVHARCHAVRGARFRFDYVVERDGTTIADGWTAHATVDAAHAPADAAAGAGSPRRSLAAAATPPAASPVGVVVRGGLPVASASSALRLRLRLRLRADADDLRLGA